MVATELIFYFVLQHLKITINENKKGMSKWAGKRSYQKH